MMLLLLLTFGFSSVGQPKAAVRPPPVLNRAEAQAQGKALVTELLSRAPEPSTRTNLLRIRDGNGRQRDLATGYKYAIVKSNDPDINKFQNPSFNENPWQTGAAAFGVLNNTSSPPCPLNDSLHVMVQWQSSRDVLARKHFTLPAGARNLVVNVALDNQVQVFLNGKDKELVRDLERKMKASAEEMNFEAAAHIRDRITALKKATETQNVISQGMEDRDIIAVAKEGAAADIQILFVRKGKLLGRKDFYLMNALETEEDDILANFINQFYTEDKEIPPEVFVSHNLPERELLEQLLCNMRTKQVRLVVPQRGTGVKLVQMALENAKVSLEQNLKTDAGLDLTLLALKSELGLKRLPHFDWGQGKILDSHPNRSGNGTRYRRSDRQ